MLQCFEHTYHSNIHIVLETTKAIFQLVLRQTTLKKLISASYKKKWLTDMCVNT